LIESIPAVIGANIGTTLSMQLVSFKIGKYCMLVIGVGFFTRFFVPYPRIKFAGLSLMGFGMIFLGMTIMSEAVHPFRDDLQPLLTGSDATHWKGMLFGVGIATLVTAVIQSSGATIGMCFALADAGVFSQLHNIYPIVLGAHIGTCATALLGSIGTHIEARRCALSHLFFNLIGVSIAMIFASPLLALVERSSTDLVRQTANLHTLVMVVGGLVVAPLAPLLVRLVRCATPTTKPSPETSFLDDELLGRPEQAVAASIRELQRVAELMLFTNRRRARREIRTNEQVINEIKLSMRDFLNRLAHYRLSRRQALLVQYIDRCMVDIERISDHIDAVADLSDNRLNIKGAIFTKDSFDRLFELYRSCADVLQLVEESLSPAVQRKEKNSSAILDARDAYRNKSMDARDYLIRSIENKTEPPLAGYYFSLYITAFDRIVKHSKSIALVEQSPSFWIKEKKLDVQAERQAPREDPELVKAEEYLRRLNEEDAL
jgi:phosphate:Na+ symporter